ncbi:unnamed protein product [Protopolystoma xenopodis]|uniref:Uncharacterized protein n=1 Tax=Protopolystoma xenopodis TaxID=117903 RepID=A0A3S5FBR4_9PLAT|nr:unnamed protein product [Protopolystoma xenopodis]
MTDRPARLSRSQTTLGIPTSSDATTPTSPSPAGPSASPRPRRLQTPRPVAGSLNLNGNSPKPVWRRNSETAEDETTSDRRQPQRINAGDEESVGNLAFFHVPLIYDWPVHDNDRCPGNLLSRQLKTIFNDTHGLLQNPVNPKWASKSFTSRSQVGPSRHRQGPPRPESSRSPQPYHTSYTDDFKCDWYPRVWTPRTTSQAASKLRSEKKSTESTLTVKQTVRACTIKK